MTARTPALLAIALVALLLPGCHLLLGGACLNDNDLPEEGPHVTGTTDRVGAVQSLARPDGWQGPLAWREYGRDDPSLRQERAVVLHTPVPLALDGFGLVDAAQRPTRWFGWRRSYSLRPSDVHGSMEGPPESLEPTPLNPQGDAALTLVATTPVPGPGGALDRYVRYARGDVEGLGNDRFALRLFDASGPLADVGLEPAGTPFSDAPVPALEVRNDRQLERALLDGAGWPIDRRFHGLYRHSLQDDGAPLTLSFDVEMSRTFVGIPLGSTTRAVDLELNQVELSLQHHGAERPSLAGSLTGGLELTGNASALNACLLPTTVTVSGEVLGPGLARLQLGLVLDDRHWLELVERAGGVVQPRSLRPGMTLSVWARLSPDGETITLEGLGQSLSLSKVGRHNQHPSVSIRFPPDGTSVAHGSLQTFAAEVDDPQFYGQGPGGMTTINPPLLADAPEAYLWDARWTYTDLDAPFPSPQPFGRPVLAAAPGVAPLLLITGDDLPPGRHRIRLEVTDHGGLVGADEIEVTVAGAPPLAPLILQPEDRETLCLNTLVPFQAQGYDPATYQPSLYDAQGQHLAGPRLLWSSDLEDLQVNGQQLEGHDVLYGFRVPGTHTVTCTALNPDGGSASSSVEVTVRPCPGNLPPSIRFVLPPVAVVGPEVASERGQPFAARVALTDPDDPLTDLTVSWTLTAVQTPAPEPPVTAAGQALVDFGHTFPDDGRSSTDRYVLQAVVRDPSGNQDAVSLSLIVRSPDQVVQ